MNWSHFKSIPWIDSRAKFVSRAPQGGVLLDIGSSDGETLRHIAELRPDLRIRATDLGGVPSSYPEATDFARGDVQREPLPWADGSIDVITCMHLVEHLADHTLLFNEIGRLLRKGGHVYFETPHPKSLIMSSPPGPSAGTFTCNFLDDLTHTKIVTTGALGHYAQQSGLTVVASGVSRNWLFAASYLFFMLAPPSRQKLTAWAHWVGWSAYLIAKK